jgi:phage I-like protein
VAKGNGRPAKAKQTGRRTDEPVLLRAEIQLGADNEPPTEIEILHAGLNTTDRPPGDWDAGPYLFDELAAAMVMANFEADAAKSPNKRRLHIDWNHGMLDPFADRERGASAGTFVPAIKNGGLVASDIEWTDEGRHDVETKRYTLFSPAMKFEYGEDGQCRPKRLLNFALVNMAGLTDARELLAASAAINRQEEIEAMEYEKLYNEAKGRISELETENKALRGASSDVVALSAAVGLAPTVQNAERVTAITGLVALRGEIFKITGATAPESAVAALQALKVKADRTDVLEAERETEKTVALRAELDGVWKKADDEKKVTPAQRPIFESSLLALSGGKVTEGVVKGARDLVAALSAQVATGTGTAAPASGTVALSPQQKMLNKQLGISDADYQKRETARLTAGA